MNYDGINVGDYQVSRGPFQDIGDGNSITLAYGSPGFIICGLALFVNVTTFSPAVSPRFDIQYGTNTNFNLYFVGAPGPRLLWNSYFSVAGPGLNLDFNYVGLPMNMQAFDVDATFSFEFHYRLVKFS